MGGHLLGGRDCQRGVRAKILNGDLWGDLTEKWRMYFCHRVLYEGTCSWSLVNTVVEPLAGTALPVTLPNIALVVSSPIALYAWVESVAQ